MGTGSQGSITAEASLCSCACNLTTQGAAVGTDCLTQSVARPDEFTAECRLSGRVRVATVPPKPGRDVARLASSGVLAWLLGS